MAVSISKLSLNLAGKFGYFWKSSNSSEEPSKAYVDRKHGLISKLRLDMVRISLLYEKLKLKEQPSIAYVGR